jgi:hypothetical protein
MGGQLMPGIGSRAFSKSDQVGGSRLLRKLAKKAANDKAWKDCCKAVDERDGHHCRVCGRYCNPRAKDLFKSVHRHHMRANDRRCGIHEPAHVISLCKRCNDEIHIDATLSLEGDASARSAESGRLCGVTVKRHGEGGWRVVKVC